MALLRSIIRKHGARPSAPARPFTLLECLEPRVLLDALPYDAQQGSDGSVTVTGTDGADVIHIRRPEDSGRRTIRISAGSGQSQVFRGVTELEVHAGGGDDTIGGSLGIDSFIDAGEGNNKVNLSLVRHGRGLPLDSITITTGGGHDTVSLNGSRNQSFLHNVVVNLGDGDNVANVNFRRRFAASPIVNVTSGTGADTLTVRQCNAGTVDSGAGDDTVRLIFRVRDRFTGDADGQARVDLLTGDGDDTVDLILSFVRRIKSFVFSGELGAGDDRLTVKEESGRRPRAHISLMGGAGNDSLIGKRFNETIDGGDGTDTCSGGGGQDSITSCEA